MKKNLGGSMTIQDYIVTDYLVDYSFRSPLNKSLEQNVTGKSNDLVIVPNISYKLIYLNIIIINIIFITIYYMSY